MSFKHYILQQYTDDRIQYVDTTTHIQEKSITSYVDKVIHHHSVLCLT